jgi:hypothetical protein
MSCGNRVPPHRRLDWYYLLPTVLDDYSRYILAWTQRTNVQAAVVIEALDLARAAAGVDRVPVVHRPGYSVTMVLHLSAQLATYLAAHGVSYTGGKQCHPMTQSKVEPCHRLPEMC